MTAKSVFQKRKGNMLPTCKEERLCSRKHRERVSMEKRKSVASIQHHEEITPDTIKNIHVENMSLAQIQKLVHLLDHSDIAEIELNRAKEGLHLTLRKLKALEYVEPANEARHMDRNEPATSPDMPSSSDNAPHLHCLQAPIVGIFHPW